MTPRRLAPCVLAALALASLCGPPASAQDLPNILGRILPFSKAASHDDPAGAKAVAALTANAQRIAQVILAKPSLASPVGFSVTPSVQTKTPLENMPAGTPSIARVVLLLQKIDPAAGKPPGVGSSVGPGVFIDINDHTALFDDAPTDVKTQQRVAVRPAEVRNGFQVYHLATTVSLVLARTDRPLFRPVTRAEYLTDLMAPMQEAIVELSKFTDPVELKAQLAALVQERAALSATDAGAPACEADTLGVRFKPCGPNDVMVARVNPDYFDRTAPASSVQLISVNYNAKDRGGLREPLRAAIDALTADELAPLMTR